MLKKLLTIVGSLILLGILGLLGYEFGYNYYEEKTWLPPDGIGPIRLGSPRRDVLFSDKYFECRNENESTKNCDDLFFSNFLNDYDSRKGQIRFRDEKVEIVGWSSQFFEPHYMEMRKFRSLTKEKLVDRFGEPDILWVSEFFDKRQYTYVEEGVSFRFFKGGGLTYYVVGSLQLQDTLFTDSRIVSLKPSVLRPVMNTSEYTVKGRNLCPSVDCPFKDDGSVKDEFVEMSLVDFTERI